jgi:hypothetical protein
MRGLPRTLVGLSSLALATLTACGEPTAPPRSASPLIGFETAKLVSCPSKESESSAALVTPLDGGTISVGGTQIAIPAGAVTTPTLFTVTVPASKYVEVEITALGVEHFLFDRDVTITIDYGRCTRSDIDAAPLTAWYIDGITDTPLSPMGGVDDKVARTVTFTTGHLSSYAIAY